MVQQGLEWLDLDILEKRADFGCHCGERVHLAIGQSQGANLHCGWYADITQRLRCRTPQGIVTVGQNLAKSSLLADLFAEIEAAVGFCPILKCGFPPKPIENIPASTLEASGISDGDQLIVERSDGPQRQAEPSAPTTSRTSIAGSSKGVQCGDSMLVVRVMKDDNSCLFRSIGYAMHHNAEISQNLRTIIAECIKKDPVNYCEAILGKPPSQYVEWILRPASWGGAIELAIFSDHFQVGIIILTAEIISIDVSTGRMDRFGQGKFDKAVCVLYTGIHYDAIALAPTLTSANNFDQTTFEPRHLDSVLDSAKKLALFWKSGHKFTDMASFTLRCEICSTGLCGQKEAQAHAMKSGHSSFVEYK